MAKLRYSKGEYVYYHAGTSGGVTGGYVAEDCESFYWISTMGELFAVDDIDIVGREPRAVNADNRGKTT